jgi:hypothetical protein
VHTLNVIEIDENALTYDLNDIDRVLSGDGDKVVGVVGETGADAVDASGVPEAEVHGAGRDVTGTFLLNASACQRPQSVRAPRPHCRQRRLLLCSRQAPRTDESRVGTPEAVRQSVDPAAQEGRLICFLRTLNMPAIIDKIADALHLHKKKDEQDGSTTQPTAHTKETVFDSSKVTVLYVLGGPGAGRMPAPLCGSCTIMTMDRQGYAMRQTRRRLSLLSSLWYFPVPVLMFRVTMCHSSR